MENPIESDIVWPASFSKSSYEFVLDTDLDQLQKRLEGILLEMAELKEERNNHVPLDGPFHEHDYLHFELRLMVLLERLAQAINADH